MARRRGNGPFIAKGRVAVVKAIEMDATDSSIFTGTVGDQNTQRMADAEQYWVLFKKHPWIRACVRIIGNAVAQEGYDIAPADGEELDENNPNVPLIHDFFRVAFVGRTNTFRKIIKATAIDMQVFGLAYWRKKYAPNGEGHDLAGLERLDPRLVHPHLNDSRTEIAFFELKRSAAVAVTDVQQAANDLTAGAVSGERIPADEIIMFSLDEAGDTVLGSPSPLEALDLTTAMDLNVRHHRTAFFRNGAQLGNAFVNKEADEDMVRAAEKQLRATKQGVRNAFSNIILTGEWDVKALQAQGKNELDFIKGSELVRDEIAAVFNVPVSKLLNVSGAMGQAGKGEDDETFEQECVLPLEENLYETLTIELLHKEFGIDDLSIIPARRNKIHPERVNVAMNGLKAGWTGNQALDYMGMPQSKAEGMDVPLFLGATAGNVAQDEPAPQGSAQAQSDTLNEATNDAEVRQKAKPRFRALPDYA